MNSNQQPTAPCKRNRNHPPTATELRRRAEARLSEKGTAADRPIKEADLQRLLHELQVHQIELEMQNEELQRAHAEVETLLMKYTALYDFAPTGYFTLDREGTIRGLNLAGASLLGTERSKLLNRRFDLSDCRGEASGLHRFPESRV